MPWSMPYMTDVLIHHSDGGSQSVTIRDTGRLTEAGIEPSVGSRGDSYDNALAETISSCSAPSGIFLLRRLKNAITAISLNLCR
ncbi:hypothetical protein Mfla_2177 [Methylobacillus flagellatus KT]|uniref:Uncharacterized protein n=1 Tax=Methylobacillus flagellatus (strain ATCC 51484 / DSM 6875 / VKM B-1610 / KT) TaxID=265072 RepID=Q1GZ93_METFK|nr:hypothetical protein Mfla_2177 [Methylobacillus flagellatus KT]